MRWLGPGIAAAGLLLAGRSALLLFGLGRPRRGPQPAMVMAGPYLRMRNPLLAGLLLGLGGVALGCPEPLTVVAAVVAPLIAHVWVVRFEEPRLLSRFGKAYEAYLDSVPRWVPRTGSSLSE